ncbi:hypothetical protein UFOVP679_17 [uncultured Caudovirales phage]|uniref:Uncharacterized protein n=1 Tax=uncultured Caudovirales phage TaxID=2100421 RepID=A0A6J5NIT5_9CAUD|nr:hypothetical protein UFOVP679_17 [uncultured Caudovirales phage]
MTSPLDLGELEPWEDGAERICEAMLARAPIAIRRAAENLYEALLFDVQDYLRENVHYNLSAELARAKREEVDAKAERDALIEEVKRLRKVVGGLVDAVAYTEVSGGRRSYGLRQSFGPAFQAARAALPAHPAGEQS